MAANELVQLELPNMPKPKQNGEKERVVAVQPISPGRVRIKVTKRPPDAK